MAFNTGLILQVWMGMWAQRALGGQGTKACRPRRTRATQLLLTNPRVHRL